jgi:monovalent cation/hydrogen antiporter
LEFLSVLVFLLLCSVGLGWIARRARLPYPIALVIGGGAVGFVPGLPPLDFDPQLLLVIVLPPILYQAALLTSWRDFKANLRPIGMLAIGLVIVTTLAVGATLKLLVPDLPWAAAFAFGAIVSPPDAVAATAVLSSMNMPRRIVTVLEGESLVNDASGLVIYKFAVAAVLTGAFSLAEATAQFGVLAAGGVVIGMAVSWLFIRIHPHLGDPFIEVLVSMSVPFVAYILAESVHTSGVLAVVAAGLFRGRFAPKMVSAEMRILARSVWDILVFMLNSLIFMLIGMQLSQIVPRLAGYTALELAVWSVAVSAVAVLVRILWVYPATWLPRWFSRSLREREPAPPNRELFIESWCGMRGIVSLAAALALPVTVQSGAPFPHRDLIVFLTFAVIFATLVGQGLTLAPLIRRLKLTSDSSILEEERRARADMGRAALVALERAAQEEHAAPDVVGRVRSEFAERVAIAGEGADAQAAGQARRLRIAAIRAERAELIRVWQENHISDDVMHELEEELDYQESRL